MRIKFIQINIYKGRYLDELVAFLKMEDADFISMKEVRKNGFNLFADKNVSLFELLGKRLQMYGVFNGDLRLKGDKSSVFGNAVFSKYKIVGKKVVTLKTFRPLTIEELDSGDSGEVREQIHRHLLDTFVIVGGRRMHVMSWHGAWTAPPRDTYETLRQAKVVSEYLKNLDAPFILGCDANNVPGSKTIGLIDDAAVNLIIGKGIVQTTHPREHKIVPRGFLVDYIFTSNHFKLLKLQVPEILVSDHLPVVAELEL